jgi:hypothetical protein
MLIEQRSCFVLNSVIATLATLSVAFGVTAARAQGEGVPHGRSIHQPQDDVGSINRPTDRNVKLLRFSDTGRAENPSLPSGLDLSGGVPSGARSHESEYASHLGPFATYHRANQVANYYRSLGYYVFGPYHNGDGYYVDVS